MRFSVELGALDSVAHLAPAPPTAAVPPTPIALGDAFATPLGLLALLALVPLIVLYLIRPRPAELRLPTFRFLSVDPERGGRHPILERLRRELLFALQALVLVALALALANPYVQGTTTVAADETVLVVDASGSMATRTDGVSRFDRAVAAAKEAVAGTTTVVVANAEGGVALREGSAERARAALDSLSVSDAEGDLEAAIARAASLADEDARVVVVSDFADWTDWRSAVAVAEAGGVEVNLVQTAGGGDGNVGVVDLAFGRTTVTATLLNTGEETATRTVELGGQRRTVALAPGDAAAETFDVPAGGGRLTVSPGDSFPTDDVAYVAAPATDAIRVLLLANEENPYLRTALSVIDGVSVTVRDPPTTVRESYDVVLVGDVDPGRLLGSTVEAARATLERGGGVAVLGQDDLGAVPVGDLSLLEPTGTESGGPAMRTRESPLVDGISFPPPGDYVTGSLRRGEALVTAFDGSPLIATAEAGTGRLLYYGYVDESSPFRFNYLYPVFWKRAVDYLAGRESLDGLNRETGTRLGFTEPVAVETPDGQVTAASVLLDRAGFYVAGERTYGASLLSADESNVTAPVVAGAVRPDEGDDVIPTERRTATLSLTPLIVALGAVLVLAELLYLRRRGDL